MRKNKKIIPFVIVVFALLNSCKKTQFPDFEPNTGTADFTNYVSVGNSLTQGYQDEGLYESTQKNSYPALLAEQMRMVTPSMKIFVQPLAQGNGSGYRHLKYINGEIEVISASDPNGYAADASWSSWGTQSTPGFYSNLGISGVRLVDCVALNTEQATINNIILNSINIPGFGSFGTNPFSRFLNFGQPPTTLSYLDHIKQSNATFFTCWLGNNDVLGYASGGGQDMTIAKMVEGILGFPLPPFVLPPNIANYKAIGLSDPEEFRQKYDSVLFAFTSRGAKGVCATIPDVTSIPLFTTLTFDVIKEKLGTSTVWIQDGNGNVRALAEGDMVLLSAITNIEENKHGNDAGNPIIHTQVLDYNEVALAKNHTVILNNHIKNTAKKYGVPVADMYEYMKTFEKGMKVDGIEFNVKYIEGGAFSLDAVHPNQRGYALVANEFIRTINNFYSSNLPLVETGKYKGIIFP